MNKSNRHPLIDALLPQARPMALEQRFMFDAAAVSAVTDPQYTADAAHTDSTAVDSGLARFAEPATVSVPVEVRALYVALNNGRKEVAFVDTGVVGYQTLVEGIRPGVKVVLLDANQDGLAQMALWAQSHSGYDAIHVLSHGQDAALYLGTETLDEARLSNSVIQSELSKLGEALNSEGDLLLYACDVASSADGKSFISYLGKMTGADIAASIDTTGATSYAGNWELEYSYGLVQENSAIAANIQFLGVLGITSSNFDNTTPNAGSFSNVAYDGWTFGITAGTVSIENSRNDEVGAGYLNDSTSDRSVIFNSWGYYSTIDGDPTKAEVATTYYFKSSDGTDFSLNSFEVSNFTPIGLGSFSVLAYKNGSAVTTSEVVNLSTSDSAGHITYTKAGTDSVSGFWGTLTFDSSFNNIDEIRITFDPPFSIPAASNGGPMALLEVDDINITNLPSNQAPVLSTPGTATYSDTSAADSFSNTTGTLSATDNENDTITYGISGSTVSGGVSTKAGTYGSLSVNTTTGAYTYTPNTSAIEGRTTNTGETFTVTASDASSSGTATFTVSITAANDTPTLTTPTAGAYTDTSANDTFSNDTGTLAGADRDAGQTLTYGISGGSVSGGTSTKNGSYGSLSVNTTTGAYTYTPNATAINALTATPRTRSP